MLRKWILFCSLLLLVSLCFGGNASSAAVTNDECMGCHGEKGLATTGPDGKTISLFFNIESYAKSVHRKLQCVRCHEVNDVPHAAKLKAVSCRNCHESSYGEYQSSVHRSGKNEKASCKDCHGYHEVQSAKTLTSSVCAGCHSNSYHDYKTGIHARNSQGPREVASCMDCHGSHAILKTSDPRSSVYHLSLPLTCSRCHADAEIVKKYKIPAQNVYNYYMDSIHGQAISKSGLLVSANCSDCHGSHAIKPHTDPTSRIYPQNIPSTCGKCHAGIETTFEKSVHGQESRKGNKDAPNCASCHQAHQVQSAKATAWVLDAIRECGSCHSALLETYRHSYHGKITNLGFTRVAKCADCHGAHEILPRLDPDSKISKKNLLETCRKCHPKANKSFTEFVVHVDYKNKSEHHGLYYIWLFMTILLVGVFGFFFIHTLLWLPRTWIERFRERQRKAGK